MKSPQLGFSFHPKWLSLTGSVEAFLRPLQEAGMTAVEFTLHPTDSDWEAFPPLIVQCQRMGLHCHFHAPYLEPYNIAGFGGEGRERIEALYRPAIILAERFAADNGGPTTLVVHGARAADRSHGQLLQDTVAFLEWLLSRNTGLQIALENLPCNHTLIKIGTSRQDLMDIIETVASSDVGMCWDLGHDVLLGATTPPNKACLRRVIHVHVHDINPMGIDHHPLIYGLVPYRSWLQPLVCEGFNGCVTLEVNGQHVGYARAERIEEMLASSLHRLAEVIGR
ncbi:MAG: sugar phosphate isomerase/epimerase family protein [Anaerolineae bacterium]|jgi:sugar phosphate isomerase/epimerase|nr:sugar phosphate isomerase/epimerase family protein [Anaerolineae bacterium]